jgi:ribosomal protein S20
MNKKQRNRKLVKQNKRNAIINRRYSSTIKSLLKLFKFKIKNLESNNETETTEKLKKDSTQIIKNLSSILDKAAKKKVIHKNAILQMHSYPVKVIPV